MMDPESSTSQGTGSFRLRDLPLEIRELIWEFALPQCRVFHVKGMSRQRLWMPPDSRDMYFKFHINHPPPVALHVCSEARTVALRKGFFLSPHEARPHGEHPGFWFNPDKDILYLDRNQRTSFHVKPNQPRIRVAGWDRVLNVGLEWRAFFRDIPRPSQDENISNYWRAAIEPLYAYMPRMKTVNYILPKARHKGGVTWGREPYGAQNFEPELLPLQEDTPIPWETHRNLGRPPPRVRLLAGIQMGAEHAASLITWSEVKRDIEKGFEEDDAVDGAETEPAREGSPSDDRDFYPPRILGWLMVRVGATFEHDNPVYHTDTS
ncbi:hypothetical protein G7Z17_g7214 [Cylindrodendrum hubeiense]|uniref:2EXR domain-containing protein n=1 Tax=Cylindrodendrum hubeiense TaxID=595255 RepID=A0A9P5HBV4_9HYPO|nr:hypothetical protein G7Z17_g7214 [Cylindrodendrum hubeiense]